MESELNYVAQERVSTFPFAKEEQAESSEALRKELVTETTSLFGTVCKRQPRADELPVLEAGKFSSGCVYQNFDENSSTRANYEAGKKSAAHFYSRSGEWTSAGAIGSGFAVAKTEDSCLILTDNHVVADSDNDFQVKMSDGVLHDAKVLKRKLENDLALVEVSTGGDTSSVCKPASVTDSERVEDFGKKDDTLTAVGYPAHSKSLYVSNGEVQGITARSNYRDGDGNELKMLHGEDANREIILLDARVEGGNSGSAIFNSKSQVGALVDAGDSDHMRNAMATPINKKMVDEMLKGIKLTD